MSTSPPKVDDSVAAGSVALAQPVANHKESTHTATNGDVNAQSHPTPTQDASMATPMSASLQSATAGLNEEDAKLLASLAEGNGLLSQLSSLAAQNANSTDFMNAYSDLMLESSATGLQSTDPDFNAAQQAFSGAVDLNEALTRQDMDWDDEAFDDLEPEDEDEEDQGPIQAYAKLEFPGFSYYIQTLDVTIGRRPGQLQANQRPGAQPPQLPNAAFGLSQAHITSESKTEGDVDVDLGPLKSISRLHARIFYYTGPLHPPHSAVLNGTQVHSRASSGNGTTPYRITSPTALSLVSGAHLLGADAPAQDPYDIASQMSAAAGTGPEEGEGQFVLMVVGRNGAFVDDVWVEKGGLVVLSKRTKIQIAERVFYFVLPPPPGAAPYGMDGDSQRAHDSEFDSLSDLSSEDRAGEDDDEEDEAEAESSSSVSSEDEFDDPENEDRGAATRSDDEAAQPAAGLTKGRRKSSVATIKGRPDPASRDDKPKRKLVLKPKSKVGETASGAAVDDPTANVPIGEPVDENPADKRKGAGKAPGKGKAAQKTTANALASRAAVKGKGKGAGSGKMPTKGSIPRVQSDGDDSDSLGTPSPGEQSSNEHEVDGITTPPPPVHSAVGASGKRPGKGLKGPKGAKNAKASKAKKVDDARQITDDATAASASIKKESPTPTWAMGAGIAGRKRKRGEAVTDEEPALKVGTPIGIEALDAAKRAKAAKGRTDTSSRAASASPKKNKSATIAAALPRSSAGNTTDAADDDDVIMVDVKSAPSKSAPSTASVNTTLSTASSASALSLPTPDATTSASAPKLTATAAGAVAPSMAPAAAAVQSDAQADDPAMHASNTAANAKPAKPKTTKPKKKKGAAAQETASTPSGVPNAPGTMVPGTAMSTTSIPVGTFAGPYIDQKTYTPSMPYDPNAASAASAIIAAANAVSGSMSGYGPPPTSALPHAVGQMASPLPMIPLAGAGRSPAPPGVGAGAATGAHPSMSMPPSMTPSPASTSASASVAASNSNPSTWPTTASIIASAASLANAQAKQSQTPAGTITTGNTPGSAASQASNSTPTPNAATGKPPPGPEDKPDLSNIELISQALRSDHCAKKGGKLTLQEVYEWIASRWIWFKRNGRHTGRDWQSSIRHAIGSSRDFTRIPRRSDEPGKGIFYTMSDSTLAEQHRANLAKQKEEAAKAATAAPSTTSGAASGTADVPVSGSSPAVGALPQGLEAKVNSSTAAAAGAAGAGAPGSLPAIRIPLIIGTPPSSATTAAPDKPKAAPGTIESLLETPPIVHHDGKLYLSPQVFGHLNAGQLAQIEGLGAQQALQVLQAYLVTHLKERMRLQQVAAQKKDATAADGKLSNGTTAVTAKPATLQSTMAKAPSAASSAPSASASGAKTDVAGANGAVTPARSASQVVSTAMAGTAPATTSLPRPPGPGTSLHPMTTLPKPVLPSPVKPSIPASSQNAVARGPGPAPGASASGPTATAASSAPQTVQPVSATKGTGAPTASSAASPSTSPGVSARALVLPSTPLRTTISGGASTPKASTQAPTTPQLVSSTKEGTSAASAYAAQKPIPPVKPTQSALSVGASATASTNTSSKTSAPGAAGEGAGDGAATVAAGPSTATGAPTASESTTGESDDPLAALSALAAHPEAAALIALLRKQQQESGASGGKQLAKLTPGQLQLLQMANKLAAQQGKKGGSGKKKKKAAAAGSGTGTRDGTGTPGPSGQESSPAPAGPTPSPGPKAT